MNIAKFVDSFTTSGRYHFTSDEAVKALNISIVAARAAIRRLRKKGVIAMPHRGFYVVVPPEYRRLGCLPPEQFTPYLMEHLCLDYYVSLLSAAEFHGAAHQRPQVFQVVVALNRPRIRCGQVRIQFVARHNVSEIPTIRKNTPRGYVLVSSAEATAFDLVGYARCCGGFNNVTTVLIELAESLKGEELAGIASLSPVPWAQRLGYLLDMVGARTLTEPLAEHVANVARDYVLLDPKQGEKGHTRSSRWKLVINIKVESDL